LPNYFVVEEVLKEKEKKTVAFWVFFSKWRSLIFEEGETNKGENRRPKRK